MGFWDNLLRAGLGVLAPKQTAPKKTPSTAGRRSSGGGSFAVPTSGITTGPRGGVTTGSGASGGGGGDAGGGGWGGGGWGGGGGGGGGGGYSSAQAAANKAARDASQRENDATRRAADAKFGLLAGFEKARDTKLGNIDANRKRSDDTLLKNYRSQIVNLEGSRLDNDKAESDATYGNIINTLRERSEALAEVASQGAGETDRLVAQLGAFRNFDANQNDINRSFFDSLRSANRAITNLNTETITGRKNIFDQAETDREAAYSNYYNQLADTWNEILNIENANTNIESESSVGYQRKYTGADKEMQLASSKSYKKKAFDDSMRTWAGQGREETRELSNNKAQVINLGGPMKTAEGATLRKW